MCGCRGVSQKHGKIQFNLRGEYRLMKVRKGYGKKYFQNVEIVQTALNILYPLVYPFRKKRSSGDIDHEYFSEEEEF